MRKLIVAVALLLGVSFLFLKKAEVQAIIATLQRGDLRFILLALLVEGFWLLNVAASYRVVYRSLGLVARINKLLILASAAIFVNVIAPSVGMGGMAVFIHQARREGQSSARVMVASMLFVLFEYLGFLCVLSAGLLILLRRDNLNSAVLVATIILVGVAGCMAAVIYLGMQSGERLGRALAWLARRAGVLLRPFLPADTLSERRAEAFAHDVAASLRALHHRGESLLLPAILAVSSKGLLILVLYLMFLAFQVPVSAGTLVAGFSIGYLFLIVSPTPAGIGVVEGALALALNSLQVPLEEAAVIALAYRGITFWIPLVAGMWAFRSLSQMDRKRLAPARGRLPAFGNIVPAIRNRGELNRE